MDVSSIRKINAMSQELKQFGFYDDSTTAVQGATSLYSTDDSASKIFSTEDQLLEELKNSFSRFKDRSQVQMDDMRKKVETLTAQVSLLQQTLQQSLSNLQNQRNSVNHNVPASPKQEQPISTPNTHSQERSSEVKEKPYYEKQGHFTSDDVKIEDIFYFGQR